MKIDDFLQSLEGTPLSEANALLKKKCGIANFFDSSNYYVVTQSIQNSKSEYGDWQTNLQLAVSVCKKIRNKGIAPELIIEPTCGVGNFVLAALMVFGKTIKRIIAIEIFEPYLTSLKYKLLEYCINNDTEITATIELYNQNIFDFKYSHLNIKRNDNILILGNPPWATNSKLSGMSSDNLPQKVNYKRLRGLDAITGKGNFDIAEYITCQILEAFKNHNATIALLLKTSVVKNIIYEQKWKKYLITNISQHNIDAKQEFNVSVSACLFIAQFGNESSSICDVYNFYNSHKINTYGWNQNSFVSDFDAYFNNQHIEGVCQLEWWSGLKHDCSKVMELERNGNLLINQLAEVVKIEDEFVYPLIKSSDIKGDIVNSSRKYIIVTQMSTGDDTKKIKYKAPLTYQYLLNHTNYFEKRKSIVYKKRGPFSIFGIGQYSFKPYKIAIAGLYKDTHFSFVPPINGKCAMFDDTCYMLGFDTKEEAFCILKVLNSEPVQNFMKSIVFFDSKRSINKEVLMRIDIYAAAQQLLQAGILDKKEFNCIENYINKNTLGALWAQSNEMYALPN